VEFLICLRPEALLFADPSQISQGDGLNTFLNSHVDHRFGHGMEQMLNLLSPFLIEPANPLALFWVRWGIFTTAQTNFLVLEWDGR
jgi:hypothetical protein